MNNSKINIILGMVIVAAIMVASASLLWSRRSNPALDPGRSHEISLWYNAMLLTRADGIGGLGSIQVPVPKIVLSSKPGFKVGDLRDAIRSAQQASDKDLYVRYDFSGYIDFLANALLGSHGGHYLRAQVNAQRVARTLSVWMIDPIHMPNASPIDRSTCAYVGYADVILCNTSLIRKALSQIDAYAKAESVGLAYCDGECPNGWRVNLRANLGDFRAIMKENFFVWLIGHEIGHAVRHREMLLRNGTALHFDLSYDVREAEADTFVSEAVMVIPTLNASFAPLLLEYVDQEFLRLYNARQSALAMVNSTADQPKQALRLPFDSDTALYFRSLRMLTTMVDARENPLSNIYFRPIGGQIGFVSSFKPTSYVRFLVDKTEGQSHPVDHGLVTWTLVSVGAAAMLCILAYLLVNRKDT